MSKNRYEQFLLKNGTFAGPVSQRMIDTAKEMYTDICKRLKHKETKIGWADFITEARFKLSGRKTHYMKEVKKDLKEWKSACGVHMINNVSCMSSSVTCENCKRAKVFPKNLR